MNTSRNESCAGNPAPSRNFTSFQDDLAKLRSDLEAAEYAYALDALTFAEEYHKGFRKDQVTPEFHHQVKIAFTLYDDRVRLQHAGLNVDEVIAIGILHDTYEDHQNKISILDLKNRFNQRIAVITVALSKIRGGKKMPRNRYFRGLLKFPEAIIVKLHDRRHNLETIDGLKAKQVAAQISETEELIDIAKEALTIYPRLQGLIQHARKQLEGYIRVLMIGMSMGRSRARKIMEALQDEMTRHGISERPPNLRRVRLRLREARIA